MKPERRAEPWQGSSSGFLSVAFPQLSPQPFSIWGEDMNNEDLPESHYVEAYLVEKPCEVIWWMEDIADLIETHAYSA